MKIINASLAKITKNINASNSPPSTKMFVAGVEKLLEIASEVEEFRDECSINVTGNTRLTCAILLSKLYENQAEDKDRDRLIATIDEFMRSDLIPLFLIYYIYIYIFFFLLLLLLAIISSTEAAWM